MSLAVRRLLRLSRRRSPSAFARAIRRELKLQHDEVSLAGALRVGERPVCVGPFVGEVGYELLYWRPFVLHLLRRYSVDPSRATAFGRGGSGLWYSEIARSSMDAFELLRPSALRAATTSRPLGSTKQLEIDAFDRELLLRSGLDDAIVVHPRFMYWRLRYFWEGLRDPSEAVANCDYDGLPRMELDDAIRHRLPPDYVAVKAYSNDCMPPDHPAAAAIVRAVSRVAPVVLLSAPVDSDTHKDVGALDGVVEVKDLLDPVTNLAQQAEIIARSKALVSTYGGFSYLGPFLDVPTVAFALRQECNVRHELVLRAARPGARFTRVGAEPEAVVRGLRA
jgi:hypothetical protein